MPGFVLVDQAVRDRYLEEFLAYRAELAVFHTKCEGHDREDDHRRKYHHEYSRWRHPVVSATVATTTITTSGPTERVKSNSIVDLIAVPEKHSISESVDHLPH